MLFRAALIPVLLAFMLGALISLPSSFAARDAERDYKATAAELATHDGAPANIANRDMRSTRWRSAVASAYGPGLWGNTMACGGKLYRGTIAVAARASRYPCGAVLRICYRRKCVDARVRDRGPHVRGRDLDLTEGLVRRAFGVSSARSWGVRTVKERCIRRCR